MDPKVKIWSAESLPSEGVWIVHKEKEEEYRILEEYFDAYPVYKLNAEDEACANLAQIYLALKFFGSLDVVSEIVKKSSEFKIAVNSLEAFTFFKEFEDKPLLGAVENVIALSYGETRYDRAIFFLENLYAISKEMSSGFFHSIHGCLSKKCWWTEIPVFYDRISVLEEIVENIPPAIRSAFEANLKNLRANIELCADKVDFNSRFMALSAYCFSLSVFYQKKELYYEAYLLIHRALDMYFTSRAIHHGYIVVKRDFMVYHDKNPALGRSEDHRIGLYTTYFDYVHKAERLPTAGEDLIRYVNKKRNSLLLTHGVDGVSQSEVRDAYLGARKIMKDQAKWVKSFDKFKFSVEIDPLFYMSDLLGVTKYLEKI